MDFGFSESNTVNMRFGFLNQGTLGDAPVNTVAPVISGTVTIGQTLSCTEGTWTGTAPITYTYQWFRDAGAIGGATNSTYVLTENELNRTVTCVVTGTNAFGASSATSNGLFTAMPLAEILGANYYDHFDYTDAATLSVTGIDINSCTSKGTNGAVMASTGTERFKVLTNQINGFQVADADGVNDFASVAASTGMYNFLHNGVGGTVIVIARVADANPNTALNFINNNQLSLSTIGYGLTYDDRASLTRENAVVSIANNGTAIRSCMNLTANNFYAPQVYNLLFDIVDSDNATAADRSRLSVNGGAIQNTNVLTAAVSASNATDNMTLGKLSGGSTFNFKGQIAEVLISNIVITPQQQTDLQNFYNFKYGAFPII